MVEYSQKNHRDKVLTFCDVCIADYCIEGRRTAPLAVGRALLGNCLSPNFNRLACLYR
jgi:hypothetical protein